MADPSDLLRLPPGVDSPDPVDGNPFPEGDVRRGFWDNATREAEEEACRLNDAFVKDRPATVEEMMPYDVAYLVGRYDIWAKRGVRVVLAREMIAPWDQWLANYANETLKTFNALSPPDVALQKLRDALIGRREHWKAEGRRNVAYQESIEGAQLDKPIAAEALQGFPKSADDDPWTKNPFREGTPAHQRIANMMLWAKEQLAFVLAKKLEDLPSEEASSRDFLDYLLGAQAEIFDVWAGAIFSEGVLTDSAAGAFSLLLDEIEKAMLAQVSNAPVNFVPKQLLVSELRTRLNQRKYYWTGLRLRGVREHKEASLVAGSCGLAAPGVDESARPEARSAKASTTAFGRNINRLRKECGWSFDALAKKAGFDKKLTLGHVNEGKGAHPNTLKVYADVFTKGLNRTVTVAELERTEPMD